MVLLVKWWMLSHNVMDVMFLVFGVETFFAWVGVRGTLETCLEGMRV